jgi:hypothetical protein
MERPRARMAVNPSRWIHLNDRTTALASDEKKKRRSLGYDLT